MKKRGRKLAKKKSAEENKEIEKFIAGFIGKEKKKEERKEERKVKKRKPKKKKKAKRVKKPKKVKKKEKITEEREEKEAEEIAEELGMPTEEEKGLERFGPEVAKEKIKIKRIPRTPTGISGLDEMTTGGYESRSIILVNGDPGGGKTTFGLQFLYSAAKKGEAGLYISFGEPRELLYPRMLAYGMDFQELEDKKLFFVIEYQPHEIAKLMAAEGGTIYDIVTTYNVKRIVIDPITPYLIQYANLYDARLALVRLFNVIRKWGATTILLNEFSKRVAPHPSTAIAEFLADGVINLIHERTADGIQIRGIEVWKLCGVAHAEIAHPFAFTDKGIVVYPKERLFAKTE